MSVTDPAPSSQPGAPSGSNARSGLDYSIDGLHPSVVLFPKSIAELSELMAASWEQGLAISPWGGGTRVDVGNRPDRLDEVIDLSGLDRVVEHNPADLTVTVEAGTVVDDLQQVLAEHGQFLAVDPPVPCRASIGGTLATAASGPAKWQYGNLRDLVIGMKVVQADGTVVKSGGRVVKNVSGYDMARLHIGGLGTLGIIAEVSFKLTPLPRNEATLLADFDSWERCLEAGVNISHSDVVPLALTAFDRAVNDRSGTGAGRGGPFLAVRLGGRLLTLQRQLRECLSLCHLSGTKSIETLEGEEAKGLWRRVADFGWDEATEPMLGARASLPPMAAGAFADALEANCTGSGLSCVRTAHVGYGTALAHWFAEDGNVDLEVLSQVVQRAREAAHRLGGSLTVERCPVALKASLDVWDEVGEPLAIMRRMKAQYDPKGTLNPGRFVGGI